MRKLIIALIVLAMPFIVSANERIQERIEKLQGEGKEIAEQLQKVEATRQQLAQRLAEIVGALKELNELEKPKEENKKGK